MQEFVWYFQVSADMRLGQEQSAANIFSWVGLQLRLGMEMHFIYDATSLILIFFLEGFFAKGLLLFFFFLSKVLLLSLFIFQL